MSSLRYDRDGDLIHQPETQLQAIAAIFAAAVARLHSRSEFTTECDATSTAQNPPETTENFLELPADTALSVLHGGYQTESTQERGAP